MEHPVTLSGKCLCGAVTFHATAKDPSIGACHCEMCRRWSSGPFFEITCQNVDFKGADNITTIRSSDWAERGFCNRCGSNLFYRILETDEYQMSAGLLNDTTNMSLTLQVFTDSKPHYYTLADKTQMMTGAEVFEMYAPPET
ncbi:aldehyde-activating protein [Aliiroseovarius zhejiangensis]|uniref:Aldehyde-activating protein n=1 Tax=Aliiroseovarius zhejiangensis TaxID=1632025 RepID=A0ABQ3J0J5_9RHOB|nr:GFA family protein [Aliiroseovarius zhejiangensis]GHE97190.1 aldehyde-activating protein [Aliiroseovarius zhejiangensis]